MIVDAVVVTYNSSRVLPDALGSLTRSGVRKVFVVDNASTDAVPDVVAAYPGAELVRLGRNAGYAAGVNAGLARSDADAVLVLNPDVRLDGDALPAMMRAMASTGVGIVVPRLIGEDGATHPSLRRDPSVGRALAEAVLGGRRASRLGTWGETVGDPASYLSEVDVDWATGAVWLVSRACSAATGAWDESFLLYSEETDYALRARAKGFRIRYTPDATVMHIGGESNTSPFLWSLLTVNRVRLVRKHGGLRRAVPFAAVVLLNEGVRALAGRPTARAAVGCLLRPSRRPRALPQH